MKEIFEMESFEQKCVISYLGVVDFQTTEKKHGCHWVWPIIRNNDFYEHRCLENINKLCKTIGKCENQQQHKTMIKATMLLTPERCTKNSPIKTNPSVSTKETIARKPFCKFKDILDVKHQTDVSRFGSAKETRKAMCCGQTLQRAMVI